jgi:hypothetical protein
MSKRKRCGHPSRRECVRPVAMGYAIECMDCGEWLPMGKANDTAPEVTIEKRAAELSRVPAGAFVTSDAQSGWYCNAKDFDPPPWPHCPDAWAGWLARLISEHDASEGGNVRAVICKEEDALALLLGLQVKEHELAERFREQGRQVETAVMRETMRAVNYVVCEWLHSHGFKVTR